MSALRYEVGDDGQLWAIHSTYRVVVESIPSGYAKSLIWMLDTVEARLKAMMPLTSPEPPANNQGGEIV
jgi:hypothetical protein